MDKLKFIAISGTTSVTQNLYVYEYGNEIIVVDCGIGMPDDPAFGVDLIIPDFGYLLKNRDKIKGVFVSHGHEDHFGAVPFLLREMQVPIYGTKLVCAFIRDKNQEYKTEVRNLIEINPEGGPIKLGSFTIDSFRVTHSVPDSVGFCITTPIGKFFHVPDYKFDWTPVDGKQFDIAKAARLAQGGVIALASDGLGATSEGYTKSEMDLEKNIEIIIERAPKKVIFTTLSSNISRMQQAIRASVRLGRKVTFIGRSIETKAEIAKELGFLEYKSDMVVAPRDARKILPNKITYIVSGSYGQIGSSLYRASQDEHDLLKFERDDVAIFSADPHPPGTEQSVNYVVDNLIERGVSVHYYDTQDDLHVSGHGSQKEIEMLAAIVNPRYFIPIGSTIRHMRAYKEMMEHMGFPKDSVFELMPGDIVEFSKDGAKRAGNVPVHDVLVDGLGIGDVGNVVLRDRKALAQEGIVVVVIQYDGASKDLINTPEIISRGFVFHKEQQPFLNQAGRDLEQQLKRKVKRADANAARGTTIDFLERYFYEQTGRRPMILPVVIEV